VRVVRIYHEGRDPAHRARDRALVEQGVELRLVVPRTWPGPSAGLDDERFDIVELDIDRPGDVNRHRYIQRELRRAIDAWHPDLVDAHEEPVSVAAKQVLAAAGALPVVMYTAQNLDKRWPPPFAGMERRALARVAGFYPCSRQAASVLRGKGYAGPISVLPLGLDPVVHHAGSQDVRANDEVVLGLVGRLVPEKGLRDAIDVLSAVRARRPARLIVVGRGPDAAAGLVRAEDRGVGNAVEWLPWLDAADLAAAYRRMHVVLVPSRSTPTWVEQFGRVITEGMANGAVPVGYASGSIPEVVGEEGLITPEGDVAALSSTVLELVEDADRWRAIRSRGLARSQKLFWSCVARDMVALYQQALETGAPGDIGPDRAAAMREFGPPARTPASRRPFALPGLRASYLAHRVLEPIADLAARRSQ